MTLMKRGGEPMRRILFICWANCVRSQLAEALLNYRCAGRVEAVSRGIEPASSGMRHHARRVLREIQIPIAFRRPRSKSWAEFRRAPRDAVVTLDDHARAQLDLLWSPGLDGPAQPPRVHWECDDPIHAETPGRVITNAERLDAFRQTRDELRDASIWWPSLRPKPSAATPRSSPFCARSAARSRTDRRDCRGKRGGSPS